MPNPVESAHLNLKLYELRREPTLREARAWFLHDFNPESLGEMATLVAGARNASFRMVLGYWEMAASLVNSGAIDRNSFLAAHGEIVATFGKIFPFLAPLREAAAEPEFCLQLEQLLSSDSLIVETMYRRRARLAQAARNKSQDPEPS